MAAGIRIGNADNVTTVLLGDGIVLDHVSPPMPEPQDPNPAEAGPTAPGRRSRKQEAH